MEIETERDNNMIDKKIGLDCTGCSACANICFKNAIEMKNNIEGFWYPSVDNNKCIECSMCVKVCPILEKKENTYLDPEVYAAWNKNESIRINSTSGGIFSALAKKILENDGIVVGAQYNLDFSVAHIVIHDNSEISMLRQSKYAQSNIGYIYREIKEYLLENRVVLFCGTPCQSMGLQKYLQKEYKNLYCCDFICR